MNNYQIDFKTWEVLAITYIIDSELKDIEEIETNVEKLSCLGKNKLFVANNIDFLQSEITNIIYTIMKNNEDKIRINKYYNTSKS